MYRLIHPWSEGSHLSCKQCQSRLTDKAVSKACCCECVCSDRDSHAAADQATCMLMTDVTVFRGPSKLPQVQDAAALQKNSQDIESLTLPKPCGLRSNEA